jgi:hypothetical protein
MFAFLNAQYFGDGIEGTLVSDKEGDAGRVLGVAMGRRHNITNAALDWSPVA